MYWQSHLSLQTADAPANQNWFELRWMITRHHWATSQEPVEWAFRVIFFVHMASDCPRLCLCLLPKANFISLCLILLTWFLSLTTDVSRSWVCFILRAPDGPFLPDAQLVCARIPAACWARLSLWGQNYVVIWTLKILTCEWGTLHGTRGSNCRFLWGEGTWFVALSLTLSSQGCFS